MNTQVRDPHESLRVTGMTRPRRRGLLPDHALL